MDKPDDNSIDYDTALKDGLVGALQSLGIWNADEQVLSILEFAARLSPDDAQPQISTTRLFAGIAAVGNAAAINAAIKPDEPYAVTLARALAEVPDLHASYQDRVVNLFRMEPAGVALARLQERWFSENVSQVLRSALSLSGSSQVSGDTIVQALLNHGSGLIYERIPMDLLAAEVKRLRSSVEPDGEGDRGDPLAIEVDAALAEISVSTIDNARKRIIRAAAYRDPGGVIQPIHILAALIENANEAYSRHPADASVMLSKAIATYGNVLSSVQTPLPPNFQSSSTSYPVRFAEATKSLLTRALRKQQEIFLNPALGAKGMVAAILTMAPEETFGEAYFSAFNFSEARSSFRTLAREQMAETPHLLQQWNRALEFESANLAKLNNDQPWSGQSRDHLDIANDALAIANVAAGKATNLPLAFGIFGDWGAGKTFFMRLIYEQIEQIVKSEVQNDGFEHAIVQIQFNAWHYAETNLWASLVGHIFEELDRWMTRENEIGSLTDAEAILSRLTTSRQLALETATELVQRRKEHNKAAKAFAEAQQNLSTAQEAAAHAPTLAWRAAVETLRESVAGDEELKQNLGAVQSALGVPKLMDDQAKLAAALDELHRSASATNVALAALRSTMGSRSTVILAIAVLIGAPAVLFLLRQGLAAVPGWMAFSEAGRGLETLGGLIAMSAVLARSLAARVKSIADKFAMLRRKIDERIMVATGEEQASASAAAAQVAQMAAGVEQAKALLQATGDQVAAALRDYAEETGGVRIRRFIRARAGNDGYGKHLGLVSTIRKDFEQLESLMLDREDPEPHLEDARKHYEARVNALIQEATSAGEAALTLDEIIRLQETTKSMSKLNVKPTMEFRRIVLYVDDLDRCEPEKVVEVLQAVNMLLSFRLFAVMVAVDARWLSQALEIKYRDFFGAANGNHDGSRNGSGPSNWTGNQGYRRATPADYLEKIFQVPYWIPAMSSDASATVVGALVQQDRITEAGPPKLENAGINLADIGKPKETVATPKAEDEQPQTMQPAGYALGLTEEEIDMLTALSPYLGGSPRRARRFVNVYRVAKASLRPGEVKQFEIGEFRALATQLAIATGAPNAFGTWVAACADKPDQGIDKILEALDIDQNEQENLLGAVDKFRGMIGANESVLELLAAQAPKAARFSFSSPRKG